LFVLYLAPAASDWLVQDLWWRIEWMALLVGGAVAVYLVTLALTGVRIRHLRG
jgi:putative peptidoglycan lipid II flippase